MTPAEARMTARERLIWELGNPGLVGYSKEDAAEFIDAFAHELAETIRASRDETRGAVQATKVMDFAASLIDPSKRPVGNEEKTA